MKILKSAACLLASTLLFAHGATADDVKTLQFDKWTIDYNCEHRGYEYFKYTVGADSGSLERYSPFHHELKLPKHCRQFSTSTYRLPKTAPISYDRGHGIHQNIWDGSKELMKESNSMANILPQASKLNRRGAWRQTEKLTECWRDKGPVTVYGGVVWGSDASNDHFKKSHGVTTPDHLWKLIEYPDGDVQAWLFPNTNEPTLERIDQYLVAPERLERLTGKRFDISRQAAGKASNRTKRLPKYCSLK